MSEKDHSSRDGPVSPGRRSRADRPLVGEPAPARTEIDPEETGEDVEIISIEAVDEAGCPIDGGIADGRKAAGEEEENEETAREKSEQALRALQADHSGLLERHLRLQAEFDNYRKRRDREAEEERAAGTRAVLQEILPIVDNLERALSSLPEGTPLPVHEGITLILRQLMELLRAHGIEQVDALGEPFDPRLHEAIAVVERDDFEDLRIIGQLQKGYICGGRLLRPALVRVVSNVGASPDSGDRAPEGSSWDE